MTWSGYSEGGTGSQERGPGKFTFQPPGTQRAQGEQAVAVQGGMRGDIGPGQTARINAPEPDPTMGLLLKMGSDMIAPHIEQAKQEKFMQGVQRAATGEALTQIVNEQPWYSQIFGATPMVEGARAYSAQAAVTSWAAQQEADMPKLANIPPDQLPSQLLKTLDSHKTGDAQVDTLVAQQALKAIPSLVKSHAREYVKQGQEKMQASQFSAFGSAVQQYQQRAQNDKTPPEEMEAAKSELLSAFQMAPGQTVESYETNMLGSLTMAAQRGDFHSMKVFEEAGLFKHMSPETQTKVIPIIDKAYREHRDAHMIDYTPKLADIGARAKNGVITAKQVKAEYDAINADYARKSGNDKYKPVGHALFESDMESATSYVFREEQKRAEEARLHAMRMREASVRSGVSMTPAGQDSNVRSNIDSGLAYKVSAEGGDAKKRMDEGFQPYIHELLSNPATAPRAVSTLALNANNGYINKDVKNDFQVLLRTGSGQALNDNFKNAYALWLQLGAASHGGDAAQAGYFSDENHTRLQAFHDALGRNPANIATQGELAYQTTTGIRARPGSSFNKAEAATAKSAVKEKYGSLEDDAALLLNIGMRGPYGTLEQAGDAKVRTKQALERAVTNGIEVVGKNAWQRTSAQPPITDYVKLPDDRLAAAMQEVLRSKTKEVSGKDKYESKVLLRGEDGKGGLARFVLYPTVDGTQHTVTFTHEDILAADRKLGMKHKATPSTGATITDPNLPGLAARFGLPQF